MLLHDVKNIKNGRIISGQRELTLDSEKFLTYKGVDIFKDVDSHIGQTRYYYIGSAGDKIQYLTLEEIEKRIDNNLSKDSKTKIPDNPFVKNQIAIAKKTLNTPSAILGILGGMTKEEAREILRKYGIKYEDSKTKDGSRPSDDIVAKWKSKAPGNLRNHPMWNPVDYAYFRNKGDSDEEIKIFWDRDYKRGKGPVTWERDSKSTKDQIAELESQKEEAKKMGYGTDAYDAKIKNLQKDSVEIKASLASQTWVVSKDGEFIKRFNSYEEAYNFAKTIGYSGYGDSADEDDVFTQDPLTEKGKEILAAMKKQYGEEKGEQVFYASKNKGTISGVDSYDPTQPRNIAAAKKLSVAQGKAATGDAPAPKEFDYLKDWQNAAMERGYRLQNSLQRGMWIAYQGNREMGTFVRTRGGKLYLDSKTKDASRSEQAYDEGYEAALQGKPFTANPYKDVSRSGYADLKESWEDGYRDGRSSKSSKDSKTKDDLEEEIKKMAREKADRPFNDDGTIRTPQQAQLAYEQWYKIIKSRYKNDSRYKDSDIIINVVENPNEEVESEEEAFDLVHYNGYNIKLVKETGEYDIYDVGGAMIGHTATLELAKLFVDNKGNAIIG